MMRYFRDIVLFSCLLLLSSSSWAATGDISIKTINSWLINKSKLGGKLTSIHAEHAVYSVNHERDLLVEAGYTDFRGVEGCCAGVLVRPELKQAKDLHNTLFDVRVLDLNKDGVSEIEGDNLSFGQGYTVDVRTISNVDGWTMKVLHRAEADSNTGIYDKSDPQYRKETVSFRYQDFNGDGILDLEEDWKIVTSKGTKFVKKRFYFIGGKLVPQ